MGPFHSVRLRNIPWIGVALHPLERRLQLLREFTFHHGKITPHFENVAHRFIAHRANVHARAARGTSPHCFFRNQIQHRFIRAAARIEVITFIDFQRGGRQKFSCVISRTNFLAAEAHDARIRIHHLFPAQILDRCRAELLDGLVVEIDVVQLAHRTALRFHPNVQRREE